MTAAIVNGYRTHAINQSCHFWEHRKKWHSDFTVFRSICQDAKDLGFRPLSAVCGRIEFARNKYAKRPCGRSRWAAIANILDSPQTCVLVAALSKRLSYLSPM
jgi:hypothetical protein